MPLEPFFDVRSITDGEHTEAVMIYPNRKAAEASHRAIASKKKSNDGAGSGPAHQDNFKASLKAGASHVRESMKVYDVRSAQDKVGTYDVLPAIEPKALIFCCQFDIDTHGFIFANLKTALAQTKEVIYDTEEKEIRKIFWPEIEALAKRTVYSQGRLPKYAFALATQKFVPDETARRAVKNPFGSLAATYSRIAHADFSEIVFDRAYKMLTKRGVPEDEAKDLDLMLVNVWKPFGQVVKDNPFCILDWTSVDAANDVHVHPRGKETTKGGLYTSSATYNPEHRWVYLSDQRDDEVWLFKQADSRAVDKQPASLAQYGFHQSFKLPNDRGSEHKTRSSIAVRLILGFEKEGGTGGAGAGASRSRL